MSEFKVDTSYRTSLKWTLQGMFQWPINRFEWGEFTHAVGVVLYFLAAWIARPLCLLAFPITVPLMAVLVQMDRKKQQKKYDDYVKRVRENYTKLAKWEDV